MSAIEHYWIFGGFCALVAILLVRLILHERITLQGSLAYLAFLVTLGVVAVAPNLIGWLSRGLGFRVPSNLFFALAIAAFALLHVFTLITLSKVELRSIALTQEVALLQEKLDRALETTPMGKSDSAAPVLEVREVRDGP